VQKAMQEARMKTMKPTVIRTTTMELGMMTMMMRRAESLATMILVVLVTAKEVASETEKTMESCLDARRNAI
jgi:hypothetical protein